MGDLYQSYAELASGQIEGIQYQRTWRTSAFSSLLHLAIHGGGIEQGTTELADATAGDVHDFYTLDGFKDPGANAELHITSTRFDEPQGLAMAKAASHIVSWHGAAGTTALTYLGGLDYNLRDQIGEALANAGFAVSVASEDLSGTDPANITNRSTRRMGVQLELTNAQRTQFFQGGDMSRAKRKNTTAAFTAYVTAVTTGIRQALVIPGKG
ncbi:poly-gamma-glutamate hydrolase family protein [Streptomyces rhizosphaericus]|uniref:Poly-gamma-glutamate hydrolase family protein n=1 Tax=Streptomyces rhizosphaericus TaxID=114699 RepID=A0A6G4AKI4_9ACTN|nr:poly-gamma-glutamate hydrolase family protein [Streptomyces rhizosphaericus]NEW73758.1 poly-gamma-glutamate hydrolase family protein [Streptomyces rhizosphaericus]